MRALGFCVSIAHAKYMAGEFSNPAWSRRRSPPIYPKQIARRHCSACALGQLRCIFSVDVLGEGVDVPNVDTVILLRPTQSATVFSQQIGRGLRLSEDKAGLTIIDLVGQQHRRFRFEDRLRALVDETNGSIRRQAEERFPYLPSGCSMMLDQQSREIVLENLRLAATATQWRTLADELRELGDVNLDTWARSTGRRISELYRQPDRSWTRLRRDAGLATAAAIQARTPSSAPCGDWTISTTPSEPSFYFDVLTHSASGPTAQSFTTRQKRLLTMLLRGLGVEQRATRSTRRSRALWPHRCVPRRARELFVALDDRSERDERPSRPTATCRWRCTPTTRAPRPCWRSATGRRSIIEVSRGRSLASRDRDRPSFVTLRKSERSFSPPRCIATTRCRAVVSTGSRRTPRTTRPQPAGATSATSPMGTKVILFVRESRRERMARARRSPA